VNQDKKRVDALFIIKKSRGLQVDKKNYNGIKSTKIETNKF